ncbi:MAG: rRNA maturation RNase YbeY [Xanthomonadales bacterium]|jgi:probable rRNA maturation factor|nr:rRNA maturation RNase YbeY [Xanthomonadales bacterium]
MAMTIELGVQRATTFEPLPEDRQFEFWVATALRDHGPAVLTVRIVERDEMHQLNQRYCGKDAATNVLSFPADLPDTIELPLLGDVVLCAPVVAEEARLQGKSPEAHWAHLTIHGVLHLLGHDHREPGEAALMEGLEIKLLESLGFPNPYG